MGKAKGLGPGEVMAAIANAAGITGRDIGRIVILPHQTFVGLDEEVLRSVLQRCPTLSLRGVEVKTSRARPRPSNAGPPSRGGGYRKGPPRGDGPPFKRGGPKGPPGGRKGPHRAPR